MCCLITIAKISHQQTFILKTHKKIFYWFIGLYVVKYLNFKMLNVMTHIIVNNLCGFFSGPLSKQIKCVCK